MNQEWNPSSSITVTPFPYLQIPAARETPAIRAHAYCSLPPLTLRAANYMSAS